MTLALKVIICVGISAMSNGCGHTALLHCTDKTVSADHVCPEPGHGPCVFCLEGLSR